MAEETLKRNLDRAFDPGPQFPDRLLLSRTIAAVKADSKALRRGMSSDWWGAPWTERFRGTLTLVSVALVVLLMGSLILSGRFWRHINAPPPSISQADLRNLESRGLLFPTVAPAAQCPLTPITLQDPGLVVGDGPVYLVSNDTPILTDWGFWTTYKFVYAAKVQGLVLIRARDLQSNQPVVFAQNPLGPSAITATGRVLGTDHLLNRTVPMHSEAVFRDPGHTAPIDKQGKLPPLTVMLGLQKSASGCIGLQIDGPNFTETLVIRLSGYGI